MHVFTKTEKNTHFRFFGKSLRRDNRTFDKNRCINITVGPEGNQCDISQGKTRIIVSSLINPIITKEKKITYTIDIKIPQKKINYLTRKVDFFSALNYETIKEIKKILSFMFSQKQLTPCAIFFKKMYWMLKVKIFVIENEGNLKDVFVLGISVAANSLKNFLYDRRCKSISPGKYKNHFNNFFDFFCINFSFILSETNEKEYVLLLDPTNYEEIFSNFTLSITLTLNAKFTHITSGLGSSLEENSIKEALKISFKKSKKVKKIIRTPLNIKINQNDVTNENNFTND